MASIKYFFLLVLLTTTLFSCKKSPDVPVAVTKPRVGTAWTYQLDTYGAGGTTFTTQNIIYRATSEKSLGGETWLDVTDSTSTTIYLFSQKTGGLYHYANSTSNLLCKEPATVNDTYSGFHNGATENFTVKEINSAIGGNPFPDFVTNKYEGLQTGVLKDIIWFNLNAWIVRKETYAVNMSGINNIKYRWRLLKIVY
jgi:hypothetical protein